MYWLDRGLIFNACRRASWIHSHAYVPTAIALQDRIRVYVAFWDQSSIGRIGFIDLDLTNPEIIMGYSKTPALNIGSPNCFDADGVTPMSIIHDGDNYRLYYVGWKRQPEPIRYTLFIGVAHSKDGHLFTRYQDKPIIGPTDTNPYLRAGAFIMKQRNNWLCWYAEHASFIKINGKCIPQYDLCYMESKDGLNWPNKGEIIFGSDQEHIFGYGRSAIWMHKEMYHALFLKRYVKYGYVKFEHATSANGISWNELENDNLTFNLNHTKEKQTSIACPNIIDVNHNKYLFYNGNDFGKDGLRLASLETQHC